MKKRQHPSCPECHRIYCYLPAVTIYLFSSKWYSVSCQHIPQSLIFFFETVVFGLQPATLHLLTNAVPGTELWFQLRELSFKPGNDTFKVKSDMPYLVKSVQKLLMNYSSDSEEKVLMSQP